MCAIANSLEVRVSVRTLAACGVWVIATAAVTGCSPRINSFTTSPGADSNLVNVQASVSDAAAVNVLQPTLGVRRAGEQAFRDAGPLVSGGGTTLRRDALALPAGSYELMLTVPYRVVFQSATQTLTRTIALTITDPPGCFFFDGTAPPTWQTSGFFEVDPAPTPDTSVPVCTGQTPVLRVAQNESSPPNYESPLSLFHSIALPVRQTCFTASAPPAVAGSTFIAVDLLSPDLTGQAGWTAADGFRVDVSSTYLPQLATNPLPQVQIAYKRPDDQFEFELNAEGQPIFHPTGPAWQTLSISKPNTDVKQAIVRVFVPRSIVVPFPDGTNHVRIDRVCAVPPGS